MSLEEIKTKYYFETNGYFYLCSYNIFNTLPTTSRKTTGFSTNIKFKIEKKII